MKLIVIICIFIALVALSEGLRCWSCDNARSNEECARTGRLQTCQQNQRACQNEVRRGSQGVLISKRCKQARACDNNFAQNPRGVWHPKQCNNDSPTSVCRCCCNFDACNAPALNCLEDNERFRLRDNFFGVSESFQLVCSMPAAPKFGKKVCNSRNKKSPIGTKCKFQCNKGYRMIGAPTSVCDQTKRSKRFSFNKPPPTCQPTSCRKRQRAPKHGSVRCSNSNSIRSVCSFACDNGFMLRGRGTTRCRPSQLWSSPSPRCVPGKCSPIQLHPSNGLVTCTNVNNQGSTCAFQCNAGFSMVGNPLLQCLSTTNKSRWNHDAPACQPILCPAHIALTNAVFECTGDWSLGSVCNFICDSGYFMDGEMESTCLDDFNDDTIGVWSSPAPSCKTLYCPRVHTNPSNGSIRCSEDAFEGDDCTFTCDQGFFLVGESSSSCRSINGTHNGAWTTSTPICKPVRCTAPMLAPTEGTMICNHGNLLGSECSFECDKGLTMIGEGMVACLDGKEGDAVWSSLPPTCEKYIVANCPEYDAPEHGGMFCSNFNIEDSVCVFNCDVGYHLDGVSFTMCNRLPSNGEIESIGKWSALAPSCKRNRCLLIQGAPSNGKVECSEDKEANSVCIFTCDVHYSLIGEPRSTCTDEGVWNHPAPLCKPSECSQVASLDNGETSCSHGNMTDSVCAFECDEYAGYTLYPPDATQRVCNEDGKWTQPMPCCKRECPTYAIMDLILVVDSSSSIGRRNWKFIKRFLSELIEIFVVSPKLTQVAVFRYNRVVDVTSQILLRDNRSNAKLLERIRALPHNGRGTNTGRAIDHVTDVVLAHENGNRPEAKDVVIVITDGKSKDDVLLPSQRLRSQGALTYAVGLELKQSRLDRNQLLEIAGNEDNVETTEGNFESLKKSLIAKLGSSICQNKCIETYNRLYTA